MKRAVWSVVFFALLGCSNTTPGNGSDDAAAQGGASGVSSGGVTATGGAAATGGVGATSGSSAGRGGAAGGASPRGGTPSTGGSPATGGAAATGGVGATGGSSAGRGDAAGGASPRGGTPSTGGAGTAGGVSGSGGATSGIAGVPTIAGCNIFPADNPWNLDISGYPLNPNSASYIANMSPSTAFHPDWGTVTEEYGIPFSTGTGATPQPLTWTEDWGTTESDPLPCPTGSNKFC